MQTLGDDVLYQVFLRAVRFPVLSLGGPLTLLDIPPLNFANVCHAWRAVIMNNPLLWSHIQIEDPQNIRWGTLHPSFLKFVKRWLENSKSAPLNIKFIFFGNGDDPICKAIVALLLSEHKRWREVNIEIYDVGLQFPITTSCSPSVAKLDLCFSFFIADVPYHIVLDLSSCTAVHNGAARLFQLDISNSLKWLLPPRRDSLHLPNLRELSFCTDLGADLDATLAVLSACPNLSFLQIFDEVTSPTTPRARSNAQQRIVLSRLVDLKLAMTDLKGSEATFDLMENVVCPSLRKFTFKSSQVVRLQHLQNFRSFFSTHGSQSSVAPLAEFKLVYSDTVAAIPPQSQREHVRALSKLLRLFHHLEQLLLREVIIDKRLIEELTMREHQNDELLCPSLSKLCIVCAKPGDAELNVETVEEMLVSRSKRGKGLTEVSFTAPGFEISGESSERMKALVEEGLVVVV